MRTKRLRQIVLCITCLYIIIIIFPCCSQENKHNTFIAECNKYYNNQDSLLHANTKLLIEIADYIDYYGTEQEQAKCFHTLAKHYFLKDSIALAINTNTNAIICAEHSTTACDSILLSRIHQLNALIYTRLNLQQKANKEIEKAKEYSRGDLPITFNDAIISASLCAEKDSKTEELAAYIKEGCHTGFRHAILFDITFFFIGVIFSSLVYIVVRLVIRRRNAIREIRKTYITRIDELEKVKYDLIILTNKQNSDIETILNEKKELSDQLSDAIKKIEINKHVADDINRENKLLNSKIVEKMKFMASHPTTLPTPSDWNDLRKLFISIMPNFFSLINKHTILRDEEEKICMLVRLHFKPSAIANVIGISKQSVAVTRARLCNKVFGIKENNASTFDKMVLEIL